MGRDVQAHGEATGTTRAAPRIAGLVLAAGRSTRMGENKLLCAWQGAPILTHAVDAALGAGLRPVCVVTGHEHERVAQALHERPVQLAHNPDYADGMAGSLRVGLRALGTAHDAVVVLLGDMPRVRPLHLQRLIEAFERGQREVVCVPMHRGRRGNPVLWPARELPALCALQGDVGGRSVLEAAGERVVRVEMPDDGVLFDVDSPSMLAALDAHDEERPA